MVNITRSGDSVLVTSFDNSQFPWSDGELSVPLNSIYYILEDETDFIVFKSVYDDSIMFTALIDEIHVNDVKVTRDTIIELIDNVINSNGGSASAGVNSINGFQGDVNIKSINGESLIGSGDITIEGGGDVDLSDYYNKSEVDTITNSLVTNVAVMGGDRIAVIQKNGNVPQEIYFPTINGQQILGVEGDITGGITEETDPVFQAWKDSSENIKIGSGATVSTTADYGTIAIGKNATSTYFGSVAIGCNAATNDVSSVAVGYNAMGLGLGQVAIGRDAEATVELSVAIGYSAGAYAANSIAIGNDATADATTPINIGNKIKYDGTNLVINNGNEDNVVPTFKKLTQAEYDALATKDENTFYIITE